MEYPGGWNLLVGSLAACRLDQPAARPQPDVAWAFLLRQGLVRDAPGDRIAFAGFVRVEVDLGPITGATIAYRVAMALEGAGIALPAGRVPDPDGKIAREKFKRMFFSD
jgi:hypothetical protein